MAYQPSEVMTCQNPIFWKIINDIIKPITGEEGASAFFKGISPKLNVMSLNSLISRPQSTSLATRRFSRVVSTYTFKI